MSFYDNDNEEDEFMDDEEETDMFAPASRLAKLASASEIKVPLPRGNSSSNNSNNHNSNSSNSSNNSSIGGGNFSDLSALPSMRGSMRKEGNAVVCRGAWALSDASHGMQHQTSDFEFSLVEAFDPSAFPSSGNYVGWFMLKQPYGKSKRIVDSNMVLNFNSSDGGIEYTVAGEGQNEFGRYYLRGKFSLTNHALHIYREYMPLPALGAQPAAAPKAARSASSTSNASVERSTSVSSSGRVRKVKKIDYDDEDEDFEENADGDEAYSSPRVKKASAKVVATNTLPRAVSSTKLEPSMQKCMSLLRDVSGLKSAYFFLEPVDPIKLNIPNYPQIVTHPMDIRTVRENLEAGFYDTPAAFADHMRLIFANAIKFNHTKDHIVNIAARELSAKFEEKFRKMHESSSSSASSSLKESKAKSTASKYNKYDDDLEDEVYQDDFGDDDDEEDFVGLGKRSKSKAPRPSRASSAHMAPAPPISRSVSSSSNNNRVSSFNSIDPKDALLNELARKVQQMEQEVVFLRTQVSKQEVKSQLEKQKEAAQTPLSTEEKKTLIDAIGQLSEERLEWVIETVRASLPPHKRSEEEIEIEIDVLDTMTLRKLQDYISGGDGRPAKKPKKETKKQQLQQQQQMMQQQQLAQRPSLPKMNSSSNNNYNNNNNNNSQYNHQDDLLGGDDALFQFDPDEEDEFGGEEIKSGTIERSVSSNAVNLAKEREREQSRELAAERYRQQQEALREEERKKREAMLRNQQSGAGGMDEDDEDDVDMF